MSGEEGEPVDLYIYDLTHGMASILSPAILGRQIEGVWHTSVVVYGREYFYGGQGVTNCPPGSTELGAPQQTQRLGRTHVPYALFTEYVEGLATSSFRGCDYKLLEHNCNHFSDEVAQFLCGARVPKHILLQPDTDLPPPLRAALTSLLEGMAPGAQVMAGGVRQLRRDSPDFLTLNTQIEEARAVSAKLDKQRSTLAEKLARKERRREKKRRKQRHLNGEPDDMAEAVEVETALAGPSARAPEPDDRPEPRAPPKDPPIVFRDLDGAAEFEKLSAALAEAALSEEERTSLDELQQYLVRGEGSWVLGDEFLTFIGAILSGAHGEAARVCALRCLAAAALREDVSLLLHQDRRHHALLAHAHNIDRLPPDEQLAIALFMCNLFENPSSSEWLLYISEWQADGVAAPLSNIRVTTKVCVHCTLCEDAALRDAGTALLYNIATKEVKTVVFDEVCAELCMAALQLAQWAPPEEPLWRALAALSRLAQHSADVPQLIAMVGPHPDAFRGTSPRIDEQIDLIMKKIK
ncbi:uncharacterized protein LOC121732282 [Aricia agestis]|uniref:uncharacterized protein LOC121732282 n=1 Tax=Aricia agestis TaxID=91739 RepID=UPI001C20BE6C|nr:uncharacterized protein LOC121732282 [Aricia agestis]